MRRTLIWGSGALVFLTVFVVNREAGLFLGCIMNPLFGFLLAREKTWAWLPALVISWTWVFLARDLYAGYNIFRVSLFGISAFPLIAWPSMLMLFYFWIHPLVQARSWKVRWLKLAAVYCFLLILFEYLGYNHAGIQLDAGRLYRGWPLLDIFHCPWWMQAAYFLNGILFSGVISLVSRRRPQRIPAPAAAEQQEEPRRMAVGSP